MKTKFQYYYPDTLQGVIKVIRSKDEDLEDNFLEIKAKTDNVFWTHTLGVTTNTTVPIALVPNKNLTLSSISHRTGVGSCDIQITKNTTAISGYTSAVSISTTVSSVSPSAVTLAPNDYLECVVTNASSLSFISLVFNCTQNI